MKLKVYITDESMQVRKLGESQQFFATVIEIPDSVAKAALSFEKKFKEYQSWLQGLQAAVASRAPGSTDTMEVPECLQGEVTKESEPKPKASVARSSSKSQKKRIAAQSDTSTSPKAAG